MTITGGREKTQVLYQEHDLVALKQGDHLCLVYDTDPLEQLPALLPYLKQGLANGERCVYVADDLTVEELSRALVADGVDVEAESARGTLVFWTREDWRQPGLLESAKKEAQVRRVIEAALAEGFPGIRFAVEMTWTLGPDIDVEALRHWEATINTIFTPDLPARIICQYSRARLSADVIIAGLVTHPIAVIGQETYANPYYEAPLVLTAPHSNGSGAAARAQWMVSQLQMAKALERERAERVTAEVALLEAEKSRQRIEELYALAQNTAKELRSANRAKDEFLALVSHELRTPITTILGNAEILRSRQDALDRHSREQSIQDIHEDAKRLSTLIGNLLLLTRLESGKTIEGEPVLIDRLVRHVIAEHCGSNSHRRVRLASPGEATMAVAQPTYVEDILRNLLSNAEKYSPTDQPIDIRVGSEGDEVVISVRDSGIGIRDEELQSLFEAFYRSPRIARQVGGMGIGLAVCRRLAEAQGGRIWAAARPDGGSEFSFALPLLQDAV